MPLLAFDIVRLSDYRVSKALALITLTTVELRYYLELLARCLCSLLPHQDLSHQAHQTLEREVFIFYRSTLLLHRQKALHGVKGRNYDCISRHGVSKALGIRAGRLWPRMDRQAGILIILKLPQEADVFIDFK